VFSEKPPSSNKKKDSAEDKNADKSIEILSAGCGTAGGVSGADIGDGGKSCENGGDCEDQEIRVPHFEGSVGWKVSLPTC